MKLKIYIIIILSFLYLQVDYAEAKGGIRIGFYNVENLFDTIDAPGSDDLHFTPEYGWNTKKYNNKIKQLSEAIELFSPDILGLAEVENSATLKDLTKYMKSGYSYKHYEGTDPRGIEVALLYKKSRFKIQSSEFLRRVNGARDILHVVLEDLVSKREYSLYVVHFPSQIHGKSGDKSRDNSIRYLNKKVALDDQTYILVMGDMNQADMVHIDNLVNVSMKNSSYGRTIGSYNYKGHWEMLDQMLLSDKLMKQTKGGLKIVDDKQLIWQDGKNAGTPRKGKPSDHLPIYIDIE